MLLWYYISAFRTVRRLPVRARSEKGRVSRGGEAAGGKNEIDLEEQTWQILTSYP